jgi:hypothetical protein
VRRRRLLALFVFAWAVAACAFGVVSALAAPGPTVSSFTLGAASPTNAGSVSWKVVFSSSVTGVAPSNFTLLPGGGINDNAAVAVSGSGTTYTVTANTGSGNGTLGLRLAAGSIKDSSNHGLQGAPYTGPSYTIDKTPPPAPTITSEPASQTTATTATFRFCDNADGDGDCGDANDLAAVKLYCQLGSGAVALCTSPTTYSTGIVQGSNTFRVYAVDLAGNTSTTTSYTWTVGKASPTITTALSASTTTIGTGVHDSATLQGAAPGAGGTVTYTVYPSVTACQNATVSGSTGEGTVTVVNGSVPVSGTFVPSSLGTFAWQAVYSGDANDKTASSGCTSEQLTVTKRSPALTTNASGPVTVGGSITDVATLTAPYGAPAATLVAFNVYASSDSHCSHPLNSSPLAAVSHTSGANPTYTSAAFTPAAAGTYNWVATFAGDASNLGASGACGTSSESSTITRANVGITTTPSAGVTIGGTVSDQATLTGAYHPTGSVIFVLYIDPLCFLPVSITTGALTGVTASSGAVSPPMAGTYYWQAIYLGDANNQSFATPCGPGNETVSVGKSAPSITTVPSAGVTVGGKVSDSATISGGYGLNGESVTFTLYSTSTCTPSSSAVYSSTNTISGGAAASGSYTTTAAGTFYWRASYAGDANNVGYTTPCGQEKVVVSAAGGGGFSVTPTGSPSFSVSGMVPGDSTNDSANPVTVKNTGTIPLSISVYAENLLDKNCTTNGLGCPAGVGNGAISSALLLTVKDLTTNTTVYSGSLAAFNTSASPLAVPGTGGPTWAPGESHQFVFTVSFPIGSQNAYQGTSASLDFVWKATG